MMITDDRLVNVLYCMFYQTVQFASKVTRTAKNTAFKNQLRNFLCDENHLYGIILVHLTSNVALKIRKCLLAARYRIFKRPPNLEILPHSLTHCLTTVASLEPKRSSTRSPFYPTTTNLPVGCAFWGSDKCTPCTPCLFFYLQSGYLSSSSNETISRRVSTLSLTSIIIDTTKLFKALRLHYCTEVPVLHDRSQDHAHSLF